MESGICQKIEEAVRSVDGIKKVTSVAQEGAANVVIEVRSDVPSVQKVLNEVQSQIDRIPSFPDLAEEPEVQQVTFRNKAITVGVVQENSSEPDAELQLRGKDKRVLGEEIASIPLITREDGVVLKVSDLGKVKDEFVDTTSISRINGKPGLAIDVNAASREDLLAMADSVKDYVKEEQLPPGYSFAIWGNSSDGRRR